MSESSSQDNIDRVELLWDNRNENLIIHWGNECREQATKHNVLGKRFKWLYSIIGVPTMIVPILVGSFSNQLKVAPTTQSVLMLFSGILSTICQFFDFSGKASAHFEYSARYAELSDEIAAECCKPKSQRRAADVYLEHCLNARNRLGASAPVL